ncbi:MAG: cytochrome c [Gemmataceae bacterium]|nr:cytochrome c [Gemmataceae bacterium]
MTRWLFAALACSALAAAPVAETPAMRGKRFLLGRVYNPPTMPASAYGNAWKHWGLKEKPAAAEHARLFEERYGLPPAPYPNDGLPMGLRYASGYGVLGGKGLTTDCLTCHGGSIFGKSYVGLGNSAIDYHALYAELNGPPSRPGRPPFQFTRVKGTTEAGAMSVYLLGYREADLGLRLVQRDFGLKDELIEDAPAWWLLKKKKTMYHTGGADTRSSRSIMQFMMSPLNFPSAFHRAEEDFKDILAYLKSIEAPKYPLPVDARLAARGKEVFADSCARCHGTYGEKATYPNKVVPLKEIGTDPARLRGISRAFGEHYNKSWFAGDHKAIETDGYQAPPLDGVWATAPYLHNGSVPTLRALLDSKARPKVFTRSYRTGRDAYDEKAVGWKVEALDRAPAGLPPLEARKVYDTTKPGRGNGGHTYGDKLKAEERTALIEYLKTL